MVSSTVGSPTSHRLEPTFQGRILFDILAVFVQGGGADAVQLASGQHGLEQVARIHGAVGFARAHDGVQFVDEQDDLVPRSCSPRSARPSAAPQTRPGTWRPPSGSPCPGKRCVLSRRFVGHVPPDNPLGQPFGDGGFAHAGLADEHRVVFGFAGQDPDHVADLIVPSDNRDPAFCSGPAPPDPAPYFFSAS